MSSDDDVPSWGIHLMDAYESEPEALEAALQSPDQAPLLLVHAPMYPEMTPKEDPKEDPVDYPFAKEEEEPSEEDPALSASGLPDSISASEETKPFKEDETAPTPTSPASPQQIITLSQTRLRRAWILVRPQTPLPSSIDAFVDSWAVVPIPPLPPPSPLSPLSSPLPRIPSPPLLLPSPTYRDMIPEANMPPRKRVRFVAPSRRFKIRESSVAAATRHPGPTLARG
ncbi:hypothetical protein Tco_1043742 [Tanacetum coccineum]|uniref:Uncharacterized protein n=1 Tax=Tanacetum coccineum TaxID=301880 RepID=A0ABQ5GQ32_9ASTR